MTITEAGLDDLKTLVRHSAKRANDWKALYGVAPLREAYLRGDSDWHVHIISTGVDFGDLCVVFQRHPCLQRCVKVNECDSESFWPYCRYGWLPDMEAEIGRAHV